MRKLWNKFRLWLISKLLSSDEKHMIHRAIDDRVDYLLRYMVEEKTADYDNVSADITQYRGVLRSFGITESY